jgi:hypothetical protein
VDTVYAALVAGGLAGIFALAGIWYGSHREHAHWLRDARRQAYADLETAILQYQMRWLFSGGLMPYAEKQAREEIEAAGLPLNPEVVSQRARAILQRQFPQPDAEVATAEIRATVTAMFGALSAIDIVGPADLAVAAKRMKDAALGNSSDMKDAEAEFLRLARKVLGTA